MRFFIVLLIGLLLVGCRSLRSVGDYVVVTSYDQLPALIGRKVQIEGVVSASKCPQVCGVDVWELDSLRGRRVRISGVLRQTVITQEQIDREIKRVGMFASRGAGVFYHLDRLHCEVVDRDTGDSSSKKAREEEGRQPNHALQTTPITRSVYEKTIEFGHHQRGV